MTLTLAQRRRRPSAFRIAPAVVPAGTIVRLPTVPMRFAGFNTASLKAKVAGLSGGDAVVLGIDTVDPATGVALVGGLGRADVVTASGNGDVAGTLYLPHRLSPAPVPGNFSLPNSDVTLFGHEWACYGDSGGGPPPFPTTWQCASTIDDYASYMARNLADPGTYGYEFGLSSTPITGTTWTVTFRMVRLFGHPLDGFSIGFSVINALGDRYESALFDCSVIGDTWVTNTITVDTPGSVGNLDVNTLTVGGHVFPVPRDPNAYAALTYVSVTTPGQPAALAQAIPFDHNLLVVDATGSTSDVTLTDLFLELTNA